MDQKTVLHQNNRTKGSYYRKDFIGNVLYYCFIYGDIHITFAKKGRKNTILEDYSTKDLENRGLISKEMHEAYKKKISSLFSLETLKNFDEHSLEDLYKFITDQRENILGLDKFELLWQLQAKESSPLNFENCLDQRELIKSVFSEKETIFVALTQASLFETMNESLNEPGLQDKKLIFIVSNHREYGLPTEEDLKKALCKEEFATAYLKNGSLITLDQKISSEKSAMLIFGENGLLDARKLKIPCGVICDPIGYHACAVAGQLGISRPVAVFVPAGFSIVENVPVTKKSRLSYLILAKLAKKYGDGIYSLSLGELYARYPDYFFNVYENDISVFPEDTILSNLQINKSEIEFDEFEKMRDKAIKNYLDSFPNCKYFTKVYTDDTEGIQGKILVHGVRIKKSDGAEVIPCGKKISLRSKMRIVSPNRTAIASNFLFFLTPKLATLYNNLRSDRPEEIAEVDAGHLDYLLEYRDGKRVETFPLFNKTCIALKEDGEFLFFNFRLGGGKISINGIDFSWNKDHVDPQSTKLPDVCIFTPYCSKSDKDADRETYRKAVGDGRVNFVLIQERITAIRDGDVFLPGMGIVISLERSIGLTLCQKLGIKENINGYFPANNISIDVKLDTPEGINRIDWEKVKWAYGGGLSLILNGTALCDGNHMEKWFDDDGWTSPLSRQTQESTLHSLAKHPRTAIGTTKNGELVILVFSGRTDASDGADYAEMCTIARELIPDVQNLMNVDGGGSAVLGMVRNGEFIELSLPSTSTGSTVGMVRPVNTVLYVPLS